MCNVQCAVCNVHVHVHANVHVHVHLCTCSHVYVHVHVHVHVHTLCVCMYGMSDCMCTLIGLALHLMKQSDLQIVEKQLKRLHSAQREPPIGVAHGILGCLL